MKAVSKTQEGHETRSSDGLSGTPPAGGLIDFGQAEFVYDPFPMGIVRPIFQDDVYRRLVDEFPPVDDFLSKPNLGKKYSLSEVNNPDLFRRHIGSHEIWKRLLREIKDPQFANTVLGLLRDHNIDLALQRPGRGRIAHGRHYLGRFRRRQLTVGEFARHLGHRPRKTQLTTRFEFSMLPADGGNIRPHTDAPQKFITLIFSMARPGEWDESFGGGTDMLKPRDPARTYNWVSDQLDFDDVDVLRTFAFQPNQCLIFVKTFNSLHSVLPMSGPADLMRKTLTVNIEAAGFV